MGPVTPGDKVFVAAAQANGHAILDREDGVLRTVEHKKSAAGPAQHARREQAELVAIRDVGTDRIGSTASSMIQNFSAVAQGDLRSLFRESFLLCTVEFRRRRGAGIQLYAQFHKEVFLPSG